MKDNWICSKCNAQLREGDKFCYKCGSPFCAIVEEQPIKKTNSASKCNKSDYKITIGETALAVGSILIISIILVISLTIYAIFFAPISFQTTTKISSSSITQQTTPVPQSSPTESNVAIYENKYDGYVIAYPKSWTIKEGSITNTFEYEKDPVKRAKLIDLTADKSVTISDPSNRAHLKISIDEDAKYYNFDEYINSIYNQYRSVRGIGLLTGEKYNLDKEKLTIDGFPSYLIQFSDYESMSIDGFINAGNKILQVNYNAPRGQYDDLIPLIGTMIKNIKMM